MGVERRKQREAAVTSALALRQQFTVHGEALERVEVFKYLGRLLAQDDDDIQAIRAQLRKARATWARVGQVLRAENVPPRVAAKFYKAVVQAVLLYGSETWVLSATALASLEGFHIRAAYRMAVRHKPRRGPRHGWIYPVGRVWDEHTRGVHHGSSADDCGVRSDPPDSHRMQAGRAEEGSSTAPVVVGATDGPGRQRSNWIRRVMARSKSCPVVRQQGKHENNWARRPLRSVTPLSCGEYLCWVRQRHTVCALV